MWGVIAHMFDRYGLGIVQIALLLYLSWKLASNHLKHIQDSIDENNKEIKSVKVKLAKIFRRQGQISERVSYLEGKTNGKKDK